MMAGRGPRAEPAEVPGKPRITGGDVDGAPDTATAVERRRVRVGVAIFTSIGALAGVLLANAEALASQHAGLAPTLAWWIMLAVHDAVLFAGIAAMTSLAGLAVGGKRRIAAAGFVGVSYLLNQTVALFQDALPRMQTSSPERLVGLAATATLALALAGLTIRRGRHTALLVAFIPAALSLATAALRLGGQSWRPVAIVLVPWLAGALILELDRFGVARGRIGAFLLATTVVLPPALLPGEGGAVASPEQAGHPAGHPDRDPDIVMIVLDTLRASQMSCYGYPRPTTPELDRFSREAVRFTRYTSSSAYSPPAHLSLLSGFYPSRQGTWIEYPDSGGSWAAELPEGSPVLAEVLQGRGYTTAAILANYSLPAKSDLGRGFDHYDERPAPDWSPRPLLFRLRHRLPEWSVLEPLRDRFATTYRSAGEMTNAALDWLARTQPERPYFLLLNYMDVHTPYVPPAPFRGRWSAANPTATLNRHGLRHPSHKELLDGKRELSAEERAQLEALYDEELAHLDSEVGRLLAWLRRSPGWRRTWVIVTSDHGEALGEHGGLGHGLDKALYQEVIHVPLLWRGSPELGLPGTVNHDPLQDVDVTPTLLSLLGERLDAIDGRPFGRGRRHRYAEASPLRDPGPHWPFAGRALNSGDIKLLVRPGAPPQLFDLSADPGETRDLAEDAPDSLTALMGELSEWSDELRGRGLATPAAERYSEELVERLRALGYLSY